MTPAQAHQQWREFLRGERNPPPSTLPATGWRGVTHPANYYVHASGIVKLRTIYTPQYDFDAERRCWVQRRWALTPPRAPA